MMTGTAASTKERTGRAVGEHGSLVRAEAPADARRDGLDAPTPVLVAAYGDNG